MTTEPASATPIRDFTALKEQHPEAHANWVAEGVAQEQKRIQAHLQMAKLTPTGELGAGLRIALGAITNGAPCDADAVGKYTAAAVNQRDVDARAADDAVVADALDGLSEAGDHSSFGARVAKRFEELTGIGRG